MAAREEGPRPPRRGRQFFFGNAIPPPYLETMSDELLKIAANCSRCVVLTGAGISAESGVPTFRGADGLWNKCKPEELATMEAFMANPKLVWEWYNWRRSLMAEVKPNPGHYAIAEMESLFEQFDLITQNVDDLHRKAGSKKPLELHGNIQRNKCVRCNKPIEIEREIDSADIPGCSLCGGSVRPDVVWFGEMLDPEIIDHAFMQSERAELFLLVGTSAVVHPAASLPVTAKHNGAVLVEINPEPTPLSELADFRFAAPSGEFLPRFVEDLKTMRVGTS